MSKNKDIVKIKDFLVGGWLLKYLAGTVDASKPLRGTRSGSVRGSAHATRSGGLEGEQWVTIVKQPHLGSLFRVGVAVHVEESMGSQMPAHSHRFPLWRSYRFPEVRVSAEPAQVTVNAGCPPGCQTTEQRAHHWPGPAQECHLLALEIRFLDQKT